MAVLVLASMLAFVFYNAIAGPKDNIYGISTGNNISVRIELAPCVGSPEIYDINPLTGSTGGGAEITITGDNLNCIDNVFVNGTIRCEPIINVDNQELRCTMPPHVEGYVDITVESLVHGSFTKYNAFRYLGDGNLPSPLPPNTGLFRLGDRIVTLYELLTAITIMILSAGALWFIIWKRSRKTRKN